MTQPSEHSQAARITLWPAAHCLFSSLSNALLALPPSELRRQCVVLPTRRLAFLLLNTLARRHGAIVPPRLMTFEEFIRHQAAVTGQVTAGPSLTPDEQELALAGLIRASSGLHIRPGHEHELRQLFGELTSWDLEREAFRRLQAAVDADCWRSDTGINSLAARFQEIESLHQRLEALLAGDGAETRESALRRQSRALACHLEAGGELPGFDRIWIVGLTSLAGMHVPLLRQLARQPRVRIWLNEPPELLAKANPLKELLKAFDGHEPDRPGQPDESPATAASAPGGPAGTMTVIRTSDPHTEIATALRLARAAIDQGTPPAAVAILLADESVYGPKVRLLLPGFDLRANVATTVPLQLTVFGAWLTALVELIRAPSDVTALAAFATHPLTLQEAAGASPPGHPEAASMAAGTHRGHWASELFSGAAVATLAARARQPGLSVDVRTALLNLDEALKPWCDAADRQVQETLAVWINRLMSVISRVGPEWTAAAPDPLAGRAPSRLEESAVQAWHGLAAVALAADTRLPTRMSGGDAARWLLERLAGLEARDIGDPLAGIQVLGIEEARYVPFELALIVGCVEGSFPKALPRDALVDPWFKRQIGLPGWSMLEAIEDTTFHLLRARLPRLVLIYPARIGSEPAVRSRFIELALAKGEATHLDLLGDSRTESEVIRCLAAQAPPPPPDPAAAERRGTDLGGYRGNRGALTARLSATALTTLIQCPYRFLLNRLGVAPVEIPDENDPRDEGAWLHRVLERALAPPLPAPAGGDDGSSFTDRMTARLRSLSEALAPESARTTSGWLQVMSKGWAEFAAHLARLYAAADADARAAAGRRELPFEVAVPPATPDEPPLRLIGTIDALDALPGGGWLITDYKRKSVPGRGDLGIGYAPQLAVYALAVAHGALGHPVPLDELVVGYWSVLNGDWQAGAGGESARARASALGLLPEPARDRLTLEDSVAAVKELWRWRHEDLIRGGRPFAPEANECDRCPYRGVCRVDDPRFQAGIKERGGLKDRLRARRGVETAPSDAAP